MDGQKDMAKVEKISKPWGCEEIISRTNRYVMKLITINKGHRLSLQYHEVKEETVYVLNGILIVWKSNEFSDHVTLSPGETYHVKPNEIHRFGATDKEDVVVLECSTTELDDVIRLADDYNRS